MSRFKDKLCPVCRAAFKDNDDVVVCPQCGTPHHRECYMSIGKCGVEDYHKYGFVWEGKLPDEKQPEPKSPEQLAEEVTDEVAFGNQDPHVGRYYYSAPKADDTDSSGQPDSNSGYGKSAEEDLTEIGMMSGINDPAIDYVYSSVRKITDDEERGEDGVCGKELCYFAGKSIIHYAQAFNAFRKGVIRNGIKKRTKISFNFCAGLFSPIHQFYRKMDLLGFGALLLSTLFTLPEFLLQYHSMNYVQLTGGMISLLQPLSIIGSIGGVAITVGLCLFGDYLYYRHCVKRIKQIRMEYDDGKAEGYYAALTECGSTSNLRAVVGALASLLVFQLAARLPLIML